MRVALFTGAGASSELGVPAMRAMVTQLRDHLAERRLAPEIVGQLEKRLKDPAYDMESMIDALDTLVAGQAAMADWGAPGEVKMPGASIVRQEAEWFVNHVCERLSAPRSVAMWTPTLRALGKHEHAIATTNYDRAVEIAAARSDLAYYDGFASFGADEWTEWQGFNGQTTQLLKLHGSTDWYHAEGADGVWKLRHAMPLFGRVSMQIEIPRVVKLRAAAVLPSREKKKNTPPYPELMYRFRQALEQSELAIFVGTSLRDPDMRELFRKAAAKVPTFLVGRNASLGADKNGTVIRQTASKFLIATLPAALEADSPVEVLKAASTDAADAGILDLVVTATEADNKPGDRCDAIERLLAYRVRLPFDVTAGLLKDTNVGVRTYALSLVVDSPRRTELIELARQQSGDASFKEELALLEALGPLAPSPPAA